ncbi:MAG: helix-turn-helix transcriptional regulator [Anaerolineaceae bacterium]|nr:helix-turn-helix transcriptional regulator [Anaerolineaceae bacterium]
MSKSEKLRSIHQKKIGVLINNARISKNRTEAECASLLHITPSEFLNFENGTTAPTLPEIELLSYFLSIPIEHFWTNELIDKSILEHSKADYSTMMQVRNKVLAIQIRLKREEKSLDLSNMAEALQISEDEYLILEQGNTPFDLITLEQIAFHLELDLKDFITTQGKIGQWNTDKVNSEAIRNLPPDIISFIINPSNEPYLRLAMHLSSLSAAKLRTIAEGLLEITF